MCAPVALGVASAAVSGAGTVASYAGQQAQTNAQNQSIANDYRRRQALQMKQTYQDYAAYNTSKADYNRQLTFNKESAARAYQSERTKLNNILAQAAFASQANLAKKAQAQGSIAATGQAGQSVARAQRMVEAAFGRNDAITAASLRSARNAMKIRNEETTRKLNNANETAYSKIYLGPGQPVPLTPPALIPGPSPIGLFAGLGSAALGGVQTGLTAKKEGWFS